MPRKATPGKGAVAHRASKRRRAPAPASEIQEALDYIRQQIATGQLRPTIADLVRLLDIRQRQHPVEIQAFWYSPNEAADTCPVCHRPNTLRCPACRNLSRAQHYEFQAPTPEEQ